MSALGVSALGGVCSGGVSAWGCLLGGCAPGGVCSWGVSAPGGCLLPRWGVSAPGGVCSWGGVSAPRGGIPACTEADIPPVNRMTNRCKNFTLATTSLRPVISTNKNAFQ